MTALPAATPVTYPDGVTAAIAVLLQLQVPPKAMLLSVLPLPLQILTAVVGSMAVGGTSIAILFVTGLQEPTV